MADEEHSDDIQASSRFDVGQTAAALNAELAHAPRRITGAQYRRAVALSFGIGFVTGASIAVILWITFSIA